MEKEERRGGDGSAANLSEPKGSSLAPLAPLPPASARTHSVSDVARSNALRSGRTGERRPRPSPS